MVFHSYAFLLRRFVRGGDVFGANIRPRRMSYKAKVLSCHVVLGIHVSNHGVGAGALYSVAAWKEEDTMLTYQKLFMRRWGSIVLLAGIVLIVASIVSSCTSMPIGKPLNTGKILNFDWLGIGYDLVYLDPENYAAPAFPGSKLPPKVFILEEMQPEVMSNMTYMVPKGVQLFPGSSKSALDLEAKEIKSGNDYRNEMQGTLKLSGGMDNLFSVSGSTSFKEVRKQTSEREERIWRAKGERETHWLNLDLLYSSKELTLSPKFRQAVQHLGDTLSYEAFIKAWGTHFSSTIVYGGKAYFKLTVTKKFVQSLHLDEKEFRAAVEGTFKKVQAKAEGSYSVAEETENTEYRLLKKIRTVAYGGDGSVIENNIGAYNAWATSVRDNPTALKLTLTEYHELLTPEFFPTDTTAEKEELLTKKRLLKNAISKYLADHIELAPEEPNFYERTFQCKELNLIGSWWDGSIEGRSVARDVLGENSGILNGVEPKTLSDGDTVFNFDPGKESNSYIRVQHSELFTQLAEAKNGYTVSLWILWDGSFHDDSDGAVLLLKGNNKKDATFALYIDSDTSGKKILKFTQKVRFHRKRWCWGGSDPCARDDFGERVYTVEEDIKERLTSGKWMHIAARFDNTWHKETMSICVDGDCSPPKDPKRQGKYSCGGYDCQEWAIKTAVDYPRQALFIGMEPGGGDQFSGKIDDIQIVLGNLSDADMMTMYEIGRNEDFFCKK